MTHFFQIIEITFNERAVIWDWSEKNRFSSDTTFKISVVLNIQVFNSLVNSADISKDTVWNVIIFSLYTPSTTIGCHYFCVFYFPNLNSGLMWCDTHGYSDSCYHVWSKLCVSVHMMCQVVWLSRQKMCVTTKVWPDRGNTSVCLKQCVFLRQAPKALCLSVIIGTLSWKNCQHGDDKTNTGHRTDRRVNTDWTCPQRLNM